MRKDPGQTRVAIVGAGLSGLTTAKILADNGYQVEIFEKQTQSDLTSQTKRPIGFTLNHLGLSALKIIGVDETVIDKAVILDSRAVHLPKGHLRLESYSNKANSIPRSQLHKILLKTIYDTPNVRLHTGTVVNDFHSMDDGCRLVAKGVNYTSKGVPLSLFDFVIGADGLFSSVRYKILNLKSDNSSRWSDPAINKLNISYKEFIVDKNVINLKPEKSLHVWPLSDCLIILIPNLQGATLGSIYCNHLYSNLLNSTEGLITLFKNNLPEFTGQLDKIVQTLEGQPLRSIGSVHCTEWFSSKAVLVGDACHAMAPFIGQGGNAALQDAVILGSLIHRMNPNWELAFAEFQKTRYLFTSRLNNLSTEHYSELASYCRTRQYVLKRVIEKALDASPKFVADLYTKTNIATTTFKVRHMLKYAYRDKNNFKALV